MARITEDSTASFAIVGVLGTALVAVALWAGTLQAKTTELEGRVERQRTYIIVKDGEQSLTNEKILQGVSEMRAELNGVKASNALIIQILKKEFSH